MGGERRGQIGARPRPPSAPVFVPRSLSHSASHRGSVSSPRARSPALADAEHLAPPAHPGGRSAAGCGAGPFASEARAYGERRSLKSIPAPPASLARSLGSSSWARE